MTRDVFTLPEALSLDEAAWALMHRGVTGAPVYDPDGRLIGVVSQSDLVDARGLLGDAAANDRCVGDVMTPALLAVGADDPIEHALEMMIAHNVHRVLVLGDDGRLLGIVTATDVLRLVAEGKLSLLDSPPAEPSFHGATDEEGSHA